MTVEEVLQAPRVAEPLGALDCTPTTDGAAAVVLTSVEKAQEHAGVRTRSSTASRSRSWTATTAGFFHDEPDYLGFRVTREAATVAYRQAGITDPREQLDVVECHDCFTITELVNYEDLGLCGRGEGGALLRDGVTSAGGDMPVNLSGGLQSCGHPVGATGVRMIKEVADQVLGRAGERQVDGARRGAAHTLGGPGVASCVAVIGAA